MHPVKYLSRQQDDIVSGLHLSEPKSIFDKSSNETLKLQ